MNLNSNTTYGNAGTQPNIANLSATIKALQEKIQKDTGVNLGSDVDTQFQQPTSFNKYQAPAVSDQRNLSKGYTEPLTTFTPQESGKTQPLPSDYSPWDMTDIYGNPTTTTPKNPVLRNWPVTLGGGQYVQDTSNPNTTIKTTRTLMEDTINPGRRKAVLGDLSPALYEVEHIIPLWAGGADVLSNLTPMNKIDHHVKTAVQSVALTLLRNKKITESEAKAMAFSWADHKNTKNLPTSEELDQGGGMMPLKQAEKIAENWKNPSMWNYFGESFKENMAGFSSPKMLTNLGNTIKSLWGGKQTSTAGLSNEGIPVIGEFAKGLAGATGLAPGSEATPESGVVGKVSNFAGNLVTMMTGIGLLSKAASGLGLMGKAAKLASSPVLKYDGIGLGFGKVKKIVDEVSESVGLVRKIATGKETAGSIAVQKHLKTMLQGAGLLSVWGQFTQTNRNLTGQEEATIKGHLKQFYNDAVFGGVTAGFGQSIKGYAGIGLSTTGIALMMGGPDVTIQDALKEGATMSALHLLGLKDTKFKAGGAATVYGGQLEQIARDQALKQAAVTLNQGSRNIPFIAEGEAVPGVYQADLTKFNTVDRVKMENELGIKIPEATTTDDYIKAHADVNRIGVDEMFGIKKDMTPKEREVVLEKMPEDKKKQWEGERLRIAIAEDTFKIRALPLEQQGVANQKYLTAIYEKAKAQQEVEGKKSFFTKKPNAYEIRSKSLLPQIPTEDYRVATKSAENFDPALLKQVEEITGNPNALVGNMPATAIGKIPKTEKFIDPVSVETINDYNEFLRGRGDKTFEETGFITNDQMDYALSSRLAQEGKIDTPGRGLRMWLVENTGGKRVARAAGMVPQETSFNAKDNPLNKSYFEQTRRLKSLVSGTPENIKENLKGDVQSKKSIDLTLEQATALFELKKTDPNLEDEAFYNIIDLKGELRKSRILQEKFDSRLNNVNLGNQMEERGTTIMPVFPEKVYGVNSPKEEQPRYDPSNPFFSVGIKDFISKKGGAPKSTMDGISETMKGILGKIFPTKEPEVTPQQASKSAGALKKMAEAPPIAPINAPIDTINTTPESVAPKGVSDTHIRVGKDGDTTIKGKQVTSSNTKVSYKNIDTLGNGQQPITKVRQTLIKNGVPEIDTESIISKTPIIDGMTYTDNVFDAITVHNNEIKIQNHIKETEAPTTPVERSTSPVEAPQSVETPITPTEPIEVMRNTISEVFNIPIEKREAAPNPKKDTSSLGIPSTKVAKEISLIDPEYDPKIYYKDGKMVSDDPNAPKKILGEMIAKNKKLYKPSVAIKEFFNDITSRLEYAKFHPVSAKEDEKSLMRIINSFNRKNPGLPDAKFRDAMGEAKKEARNFARGMIDEQYKGTYEFNAEPIPENKYKRTESEKMNVLERRFKQLNDRENTTLFKDYKNPQGDKMEGTEENPFAGVPLKSFEKTELNDVTIKLEKYKELEKQSEEITQKALEEDRPLTETEKKELYKLEKERFSLSRDYERNQDMVLADKFDLKLKQPTKEGFINLSFGENGEPMFSREYLDAHPEYKDTTPLERYGKILSKELDVLKKEKEIPGREYALNLRKIISGKTLEKKEMIPYAQSRAKAFSEAIKKGYGKNWSTDWSVNAGIRKDRVRGFRQATPEGMGVSASFGSISAKTRAKNPLWAEIGVGKAYEVNKAKTDKMLKAKIDFGGEKDPSVTSNDILTPDEIDWMNTQGASNKNVLSELDVLKDLTPFEKRSYNAILNTEARNQLVDDYNYLIKIEPVPTRVLPDGTVIPGTKDKIEEVFTKIKAMSIHIPEEIKTWKIGNTITLKNKGAPTAEQGIQDGFNEAMGIIRATKKKISGSIKYEDIKNKVLGITPKVKSPDTVKNPNVIEKPKEQSKLFEEVQTPKSNTKDLFEQGYGLQIVKSSDLLYRLKTEESDTFYDWYPGTGTIMEFKDGGQKNIGKIKDPEDVAIFINERESGGKGGPYKGKGGPDGKGGILGKAWNGIQDLMSSKTYYNADDPNNTTSFSTPGQVTLPLTPPKSIFNFKQPKPVVEPVYQVRGIQVKDPDLTEASHILYGEVSNNPNTQKEEVRTAMNTAINRALQDQGRYGGSLTKVLQAPAQYQSYAPNGIRVNGKVIESQYQKLKRGAMNETDKQKLATITGVLNEMKSGSFLDNTGGKTFYVHDSSGHMWSGKTQKEAKDLANKNEKLLKTKKSSWKKTMGYPA